MGYSTPTPFRGQPRPQSSRSSRGRLKFSNIASIAVLLSLAGAATAEAAENDAGAEPHGKDTTLSIKAGTLGIVVDTTRYISDRVNYRIWVSQSVDGLTDGWTDALPDVTGCGCEPLYEPYSYDYKWQTLGGLLGWHPFNGAFRPFRVSAGLLLNNNNTYIKINISPYGDYHIGKNNYDSAEVSQPHGKLSYRHFAAYIGAGWGNALTRNGRWTISGDVGLLYQGRPSVTFDAAGNVPGLQEDIEMERAAVRSRGRLWPVLSFGVGYKW